MQLVDCQELVKWQQPQTKDRQLAAQLGIKGLRALQPLPLPREALSVPHPDR